MFRDFTHEQAKKIFFSHLKWYGFVQLHENGKDIMINETYMKQLEIKDWIPQYLPIEIKDAEQKADYPNRLLTLGDAIDKLDFGETVGWMIFGSYHRLDNHDDTLLNTQIDSGVDWLEIEVKPETIPNNSNFALLFTLKKTKSLMRMIKKEKTFHFLPQISGQMGRPW